MRHNFIAHRGLTNQEINFAYLRLKIDDLSQHVHVKHLKRISYKSEWYSDFLKLIEYLIELVDEKFKKEAKKVWDHLLKEFSPELLAQLKIAGPKN